MSLTDYLHGVQFINDPIVPIPVSYPRSSVIGLIGTAPVHTVPGDNKTVNRLVLVNSAQRAAQYFGNRVPGFSIPAALEAIYRQKVGLVLVVNVWDQSKAAHKEAVTAANYTLDANGVATLPHKFGFNFVVKNAGATVTYVAGTDYTVNAVEGTITRVAGGAIATAVGTQINVAFDKPKPSGVTPAEIIGGTDSITGLRTGMQVLLEGFASFGFNPRILIAPGYSTIPSVAAELNVLANRTRGHALVDAPPDAKLEETISGRNSTNGIVKNLLSASPRMVPCYPHVIGITEEVEPYSQYLAGVMARTDSEFGFWHSPSNKPLEGVLATNTKLTCSHTDPTADIQLLNAVGVATIYGAVSNSTFAAAYRSWGNRSAAYPSQTIPQNFISMQRIEDQLHIALEQALLYYVDKPISNALIEAIVQTVKSFIRLMISQGALIDGNCYFNPEDNPSEEISAGHLTFRMDFIGPPPLERATFKSRQNISYLSQLGRRALGRTTMGVAAERQSVAL